MDTTRAMIKANGKLNELYRIRVSRYNMLLTTAVLVADKLHEEARLTDVLVLTVDTAARG